MLELLIVAAILPLGGYVCWLNRPTPEPILVKAKRTYPVLPRKPRKH